MCGRYLLAVDVDNLEIIYDIVNRGTIDADWQLANKPPKDPRFIDASSGLSRTLFPTHLAPVIMDKRMGLMAWGYHLSTVKGPIINCRIESLIDKPFFHEALAKRRVLVPASAYYEWQTLQGPKVPFTIAPKVPGLLNFAGIYFKEVDNWGQTAWRFALITTPAVGRVASIHDRMPLILSGDRMVQWVSRSEIVKPSHLSQWLINPQHGEGLRLFEGILQGAALNQSLSS